MKKLALFTSALILIFGTTFISGCGLFQTNPNKPSICDGVEGSLICDTVKNPETADILLQLTSYEMLKNGVFSKEDVFNFLNDIELLLNNIVTWSDLVYYVTNRVEFLGEKMGVELYILTQYSSALNQPIAISEFDKELLLIHIEKQKRLVNLYSGD